MIDPIDAGLRLFEAGRHDLAEKEFRRALAADPDHAVAHAQLALCLLDGRARIDEALSEADEALRLGPEISFVHYVRGLVAITAGPGYLDQAECSAREAVALGPTFPLFHGFLANVLLARCRFPEALAEAEEGLRLDPTDVYCLNLRAMALTRLNRKDEAARALDQAIANAPEDALTHLNLGWSRLHHGDHDAAAAHFREALRLNPGSTPARFGSYVASGRSSWFYRRCLGALLWCSRHSARPSPESSHRNQFVRAIRREWVRSLMSILFGVCVVNLTLVFVIAEDELKEYGQPSMTSRAISIALACLVLLLLGNRALVSFVRQFRPAGRFLLSPNDRLEANAVAATCLTSFMAAVVAFTTGLRFFSFLMTYCALMVPALRQFTWIAFQRPDRPRRTYPARRRRVLLTMLCVIATGAIVSAKFSVSGRPSAWALGIVASFPMTLFPLFMMRLHRLAPPPVRPDPPPRPQPVPPLPPSDPSASFTLDTRL